MSEQATKDPLILINLRAMEYIWNQCPKTEKDGEEYVLYEKDDIPYLYYSGLVDTDTYSLEDWSQAFEDCKDEEERYWISHEKMLNLGKYRYAKRIREPFDPLKVRTGRYSVERYWQLFENSVLPSCSLDPQFLKNTFDAIVRQKKNTQEVMGDGIKALKEFKSDLDDEKISQRTTIQYIADEDGKEYIEINQEQLEGLKLLIDKFPSPRRKMELAVEELRLEKLQKLADQSNLGQKSSFEAGKDFRETTKKDLKDMLVKASADPLAGRKPMDEVLDLKALQKKNRPTKF